MPHKPRQLFKSSTRLAVIKSPIKDIAASKGPNKGIKLEPIRTHHACSHTTSQQCVIPVEVALVRQAGAEACDINIMLCAQGVEDIIRQRPLLGQIKITFQNLR